MTAPTKYRSSFTGSEIDRLLASISDKLDASVIKNDFTGGVNLVASAELAKQLNFQIERVLDPNYFKQLFLQIPDSNLFTNADKFKLDAVDNTTYKGVYATPADRSTNLSTSGFTGKEITFLLSDADGLQSWDYWDTGSGSWKKAKLVTADELADQTFATVGTGIVASYAIADKKFGKFLIYATRSTDFQGFEFLVGTNGTDTYISSYGEVGNAALFDVDATITSGTVNVRCTTLTSAVTVRARRLSNF